jgi:hypothetical protein
MYVRKSGTHKKIRGFDHEEKPCLNSRQTLTKELRASISLHTGQLNRVQVANGKKEITKLAK